LFAALLCEARQMRERLDPAYVQKDNPNLAFESNIFGAVTIQYFNE
jgi:hypothetical protein